MPGIYFRAGQSAYHAGANVFDTPAGFTHLQRKHFIEGFAAEELQSHPRRFPRTPIVEQTGRLSQRRRRLGRVWKPRQNGHSKPQHALAH